MSATRPVDLEARGLKGPSSTWTYLVNDDQFNGLIALGKHAVDRLADETLSISNRDCHAYERVCHRDLP